MARVTDTRSVLSMLEAEAMHYLRKHSAFASGKLVLGTVTVHDPLDRPFAGEIVIRVTAKDHDAETNLEARMFCVHVRINQETVLRAIQGWGPHRGPMSEEVGIIIRGALDEAAAELYRAFIGIRHGEASKLGVSKEYLEGQEELAEDYFIHGSSYYPDGTEVYKASFER